jgi:hypothetical protein
MKQRPKTKRERFETVASKRVQTILDKLETLSKCSNTNNYEYSDTDVRKMFRAIKEKLRDVESMFLPKSNKKGNTFSFNK